MKNMNAKCYCGHKLAQHNRDGNCAICNCHSFTERLSYSCEVCNEFLPILDAPNAEIVRLRYRDDGRNYAHKKCLVKRRDDKVAAQLRAATAAKERASKEKPTEAPPQPTLVPLGLDDVLTLMGLLNRLGILDHMGNADRESLNTDEEFKLLNRINSVIPGGDATEEEEDEEVWI